VPEAADQLQQLDDLGETLWSGTAFRHTAPHRDPLSGEGARRFGGRWNPPDLFATLYLADPVATCIAEFERTARGQAKGARSFLERSVHHINVANLVTADLRSPEALAAVGLSLESVSDDHWEPCQRVGELAHYLGLQGLLAPSATGLGIVVVVFEGRVRIGQLDVLSTHPMQSYR
jgi:RES domain-containing protein